MITMNVQEFRARLFCNTVQGSDVAYCAHCKGHIWPNMPVSVCETKTGTYGFTQMRKVHTETCKKDYLSKSVGDPRTTTNAVPRKAGV